MIKLLEINTASWVVLVILAVILDWIVGDPIWIPHPVVLIGKWIGFLEKRLNKGQNRMLKGLVMWWLVILPILLIVIGVQSLAFQWGKFPFAVINLWLLQTTLATKSLKDSVMEVYNALIKNDLPEARKFTGYLVGRDTQNLDKKNIIRAVVETTAENTIDGILAPLFYMIIGCLFNFFIPMLNPLLFAMVYKGVNTMDSMVGYIQEPYREFGYISAKMDDGFNFCFARLGSWFMLAGGFFLGYNCKAGKKIYLRDRKNHKSPNAGHPESVVAGLLGIELGGDNLYFGQLLKKPTIGDPINVLAIEDIRSTVTIGVASEVVVLVAMLLFSGIIVALGLV